MGSYIWILVYGYAPVWMWIFWDMDMVWIWRRECDMGMGMRCVVLVVTTGRWRMLHRGLQWMLQVECGWLVTWRVHCGVQSMRYGHGDGWRGRGDGHGD
jgi:hypothetical protein